MRSGTGRVGAAGSPKRSDLEEEDYDENEQQMADKNKIGAPWQDRELDVIVADYFEMLSDDLAGKPYIEARHNAAVMAETGRTHPFGDIREDKVRGARSGTLAAAF